MILLVNGPNLNLLGEGEPRVEGSTTLGEIERMVSDTCSGYGIEVLAIQSNYEGALIDFLQEHRREARGVIVNPGALAHSSFALHDCLKAMASPVIVVSLSSPQATEESRRQEVATPPTAGRIAGLGPLGYYLAAIWHCQQIQLARQAESLPEAANASEGAHNLAELTEDLNALAVSEDVPMSGPPGEYEG